MPSIKAISDLEPVSLSLINGGYSGSLYQALASSDVWDGPRLSPLLGVKPTFLASSSISRCGLGAAIRIRVVTVGLQVKPDLTGLPRLVRF